MAQKQQKVTYRASALYFFCCQFWLLTRNILKKKDILICRLCYTHIALVLITALISCDNISSIMKKMGENVAGTDETYVAEAAERTKVAEEDKTKAEKTENTKIGETTLTTSTKITYTDKKDGNEKELITVGIKTEEGGKEVQVIAIGETSISLPGTISADVAGITSLLPPKDLKDITAIFDSTGKEKLVEMVNTPVTDETTLEAAKGTATLIQGLMETVSIAIGNDETNKAKTLVDLLMYKISVQNMRRLHRLKETATLSSTTTPISNSVSATSSTLPSSISRLPVISEIFFLSLKTGTVLQHGSFLNTLVQEQNSDFWICSLSEVDSIAGTIQSEYLSISGFFV